MEETGILENPTLLSVVLPNFEPGLIGSLKNRSNPMRIINFHPGVRIAGTFGHFVVSLEAPSHYEWASA